MDNHPELRALKVGAQQAKQRATLGPLFIGLGFTPEQIEQALEQRARHWERKKAQFEAGLKPVPGYPEFRALFGDAATERLIEFDNSRWGGEMFEGRLARELSADLYYTDEPFTAQQTQRLTEIYTSAKTTNDKAANYLTRYISLNWDQVLVEAESVLSPAQLQGLRAQAANARMQIVYQTAAKEATAAPKP